MTEGGWDSDAETVVSNLEEALNLALDAHSPARRMVPIGENAAAGIGQGAGAYDFSADAESITSSFQNALETALGRDHSTGKSLARTLGGDIADNIGSGMDSYDFSPTATAASAGLRGAVSAVFNANLLSAFGTVSMGGIAAAMTAFSFSAAADSVGSEARSAISGSLNSYSLRSAGVNVMNGLIAGINAGRSGVVSAMRSAARAAVDAAKSELKIASPSGVFRDEVGVMAMRGFGEGALMETKEQMKAVRNAARYLTDAAREGAIAVHGGNSSTYNRNSTVNLNVQSMSIRDEMDIRSLAVEIASLTRRQ